jgi:corrinoid protein of di/trimethylamine methyltransferase
MIANANQEEIIQGFRQSVIDGDKELAVQLAGRALAQKIDPPVAFEQGLKAGIQEVGERFACFEMFLPELVMGANTMKAGGAVLAAEIERGGGQQASLGKVLVGTVAGDLHDIGKTIVATLLSANGFEVVDLGVDVPVERFVQAVADEKPDIPGMSSLLTATARELAKVIQALQDSGLRPAVKVIVGGGAVTEAYADQIGADGYGHDAELGVRVARHLLGIAPEGSAGGGVPGRDGSVV